MKFDHLPLNDKWGIYYLMKSFHISECHEKCNEWTAYTSNNFFETITPLASKHTKITFGPFYPEPPTTPDVVQTSMEYFCKVSRHLNQTSTVITCDQAIYDIVKAINDKLPEIFGNVVLILGGFHIAQNFLRTIGFFLKNSGFQELLLRSEICNTLNFAQGILNAKNFYKTIECHSLISEAIFSILFDAFTKWLEEEEHTEVLDELENCLLSINKNTKNDVSDKVLL